MLLPEFIENRLGTFGTESIDADLLWSALEEWLAGEFEVDGLFYGTYPVGVTANGLSSLHERGLWKVTYPAAFLEAVANNPLSDDRVTAFILEHRRPCFWHRDETWAGATETQIQRRALNRLHGMDVGLGLPVLYGSGQICGGFGLRHGPQDAEAFDRLLEGRVDSLAEQLAAFDAVFRTPFARTRFALSRQEIRVLSLVAGGMTVAQAGWEMNLSPKTAEAYLAAARRKTRSRSTAEAVAKTIFFQLA
ncbi:helix-turn-helix transcriptional regulator [Zhengella sp. ZM62]